MHKTINILLTNYQKNMAGQEHSCRPFVDVILVHASATVSLPGICKEKRRNNPPFEKSWILWWLFCFKLDVLFFKSEGLEDLVSDVNQVLGIEISFYIDVSA